MQTPTAAFKASHNATPAQTYVIVMMPHSAKFGSALCRDLPESGKPVSLRCTARILGMRRRNMNCCRCGAHPALRHHSRLIGLQKPAMGWTHSSVCTGGVVVAEGDGGFALGAAMVASFLEVATRASFSTCAAAGLVPLPTSALAARTRSFEACRRGRADPDRSIPQERAIEGPAV